MASSAAAAIEEPALDAVKSRALQDELQLSTSQDFLKCMAKEGLGVGGESVVFSVLLKKVNKLGKVQPRVLVLTSGAIYSFKQGQCVAA